jgi:hypothetical protein
LNLDSADAADLLTERLPAAVVLVFIKEKPLATAIEHDVLSESISEGNILITADDDEEAATASR